MSCSHTINHNKIPPNIKDTFKEMYNARIADY